MSVVVVSISMDIKAVTSRVSEVSYRSSEVIESLGSIVGLVLSDNSSSIVSHELSSLVGDSIVSSSSSSDSS